MKAITVANIQAGFRQTGIYPVNPSALNPALLGPSRATNNVANLDLSDQGKDNVCAMLCFSSNYCIVLTIPFCRSTSICIILQDFTHFLIEIRHVPLSNYSSKSGNLKLWYEKQCGEG